MQHAVITGATHGIGKAVAEKLLQEGVSVAICARNAAELQALQTEWQHRYPGATILAQATDVGDKAALSAFAATITEAFSTVDILVNNAGTFMPGTLMDEADGHLETMMQVNVYSAYHLTRLLLPVIKKSQCGHIFNMCSVASLKAYPNGGSYSISKYALLGFSDNLRYELMGDNIRVTALCPGATDSRSWEGSGVSQERIMEAADIAQMLWAAYSLSPQANVETIVIRPQLGDL